MLEVQIENIIPVTEARDKFNQLVDGVESSDNMYVMTKNGKPTAVLVGVHHLEKLTGESHEDLFGNNSKETEDTLDTQTTPAGDLNQTANTGAAQPMADQNTAPAADASGAAPTNPVTDTQSTMADDATQAAPTPATESPLSAGIAPDPAAFSPSTPAPATTPDPFASGAPTDAAATPAPTTDPNSAATAPATPAPDPMNQTPQAPAA